MCLRVALSPTLLPRTVPWHLLGEMTVIMILTRVDFPAPFGPRRPKISPLPTVMSTPRRALIRFL